MPLTITHLNADTTFLLTFTPTISSSSASSSFSILLDPWLTGPSITLHKYFASASHTIAPSITHLSQLPSTPNIILISQNKSDHCHEATLRQLPPNLGSDNENNTNNKSIILAEPGAAKRIRGWKYFDPKRVRKIPKYEARKEGGEGEGSVVRCNIERLDSEGQDGEVTIALIPAAQMSMGVHTAIGITYREPTAGGAGCDNGDDDDDGGHVVGREGESGNEKKAEAKKPAASSADPKPGAHARPVTAPTAILLEPNGNGSATSPADSPLASPKRSILSAPPLSPTSITSNPTTTATPTSPVLLSQKSAASPSNSASNAPPNDANPPRAPILSILYTPHGTFSHTTLQSYLTSHLRPLSALPLTALIHSFDAVRNPWYLGGTISLGARGDNNNNNNNNSIAGSSRSPTRRRSSSPSLRRGASPGAAAARNLAG
ncbi:hypothetical protein AJ80_09655, partial [Polytolypa hystricis UAMH7299]